MVSKKEYLYDLRALKENTAFVRYMKANRAAIDWQLNLLATTDPKDSVAIAELQGKISVRVALEKEYKEVEKMLAELSVEKKIVKESKSGIVPPKEVNAQ